MTSIKKNFLTDATWNPETPYVIEKKKLARNRASVCLCIPEN